MPLTNDLPQQIYPVCLSTALTDSKVTQSSQTLLTCSTPPMTLYFQSYNRFCNDLLEFINTDWQGHNHSEHPFILQILRNY